MRLVALILLSGVIASLFPGDTGWFEPVCGSDVGVEWYDVQGDSKIEILKDLFEKGPRDERGAPRFAYTKWNVKWHWATFGDGKPEFEEMNLTCNVTIRLPHLVQSQNRPKALQESWNRFIAGTITHERNHLTHVALLAPKIPVLIKEAAKVNPNLNAEQANKIGYSILDQIKELDRDYDKRTGHGGTEGITARSL